MSLAERSRRRVREAHDRFDADADDVREVTDEWALSPAEYERTVERFEAGTLGGAGVWLTNDDGEVLLVRHEGNVGWADPGGKQEPGESLAETARREVREETGVDCRLTGVRELHHVAITDAEDPTRPPVHRLIVIFAGEYESGTVTPAEGEISDARWWDRHPDALLYDAVADRSIPAAE